MPAAGKLITDALDALLPARCPGCGRWGAPVCDRCVATLTAPPYAEPPPPIDWWAACFAYEGVARELVARAKYRNERRFIGLVAHEVVRAITSAPERIDLITWAPASAQRIRAHGVDHGELLARAVARLVNVPAAQCLHRVSGRAQTGLQASERRVGPELRAVRRVGGVTVLVVDDVATTGGTLAAAARALVGPNGGAGRVFAATIARTPPPGTGRAPRAYTPNTPVGTRETNSIGSTWTS